MSLQGGVEVGWAGFERRSTHGLSSDRRRRWPQDAKRTPLSVQRGDGTLQVGVRGAKARTHCMPNAEAERMPRDERVASVQPGVEMPKMGRGAHRLLNDRGR